MSISLRPVTDLRTLLELEPVKPDAFLGSGPNLGWGRIYGGQVVAQALQAGLVLNVTADTVVRLLPPLILSADEARQNAAILSPLIKAFLAEPK